MSTSNDSNNSSSGSAAHDQDKADTQDRANTHDKAHNHAESDEDCEICGPTIELTRGGHLRLRHSSSNDIPGLTALYRRLAPRDLRRRFFTAGPPSGRFLEDWSTLEAGGGFGLVAEVSTDDGINIVGEAGYARLANKGNEGELGITVAPDSRGWLGPWLLDRLLAHAAHRGIENLQAVVLVDNRIMMELAAKRGYAVLEHLDWGTVRITMATGGSVPGWPSVHDKPRVLIETDHSRWVGEEALAEAGFDIVLCGEWCRKGRSCPVLEGETCPLIDGADAVVVDLADPKRVNELLHKEQQLHPGIRQVSGMRLDPDAVVDELSDLLDETDTANEAGTANETGTEIGEP